MTAHSIPNRHAGGKFLTIEKLNERERQDHARFGRHCQTIYRAPSASERCYTSTKGCLTHITRYIAERYDWETGALLGSTPHAWCNTFPGLGGVSNGGTNAVVWIDPATEMFGCHRCISVVEKHGGESLHLVPNTGCEATGGERYRSGGAA